MKIRLWRPLLLALLSSTLFLGTPAQAEAPTDAQMQALVAGGQLYLFNAFVEDASDSTKGYWGSQSFPETAAAVMALLESGKYGDTAYAAKIDKAIAFIKGYVQTDGGIYQSHSTYENGLALVALSLYGQLTTQDDAYKTMVENAMLYAIHGQYSGGGWGYSPGGSPDMSNTQFGIMGLYYGSHYLGVPIDPSVPADAAGPANDTKSNWSNRFYNILKAEPGGYQVADGHYRYANNYDYTNLSMTGAGLWSLAMIGKGTITNADPATEADKAVNWFSANYVALLGDTTWKNITNKDYYMVYAVAKGLSATLGAANNLGTQTWAAGLKSALFDQMVTAGEENHWVDQYWLSSYPTLATSFVLMSLSFADVNAEVIEANLADPAPPADPVANPPPPIRGLVRLGVIGGITISGAGRKNARDDGGVEPVGVKLPLGSFDFTLNHVPVGGVAVLTIIPPAGAFDPTNASSFVEADGTTLKAGLSWFKIVAGSWKGTVPIVVDPVAKTITVTLRDGGPEDSDGLANGTIVDPGAPGFVAPAATAGANDNSLGCSLGHNGSPDPTLPLLVAGALAYLMRRRA